MPLLSGADALYLGGTPADALYLGATELWTAEAPLPPLVTDGLVAHFDAALGVTSSSERVSAWADQSGNGNDLTQATAASQPYLTLDWAGRPMVQCENHTLAATVATAISNRAMSVFAVLRNNHRGAQTAVTSGSIGSIHDPGGTTLNGVHLAGRQSSSKWTATPAVLGFSSPATGNLLAFNNTRPMESLTLAPVGNGTTINVGGRNAFYEVLVYNRAVTQAEAEQIVARLTAKYALPTTYSIQLVADGDSITQGTGSARSNGFLLQATDDTNLNWRITNLGVGGSTWASMTSRAASADWYIEPGFDRNIFHAMSGRNDMGSTGGFLTPAQVYDAAKAYCAARIAAGYDEVWIGQQISSDNAANDVAYNNLLRGEANGGTGAGIVAEVPGVTRVIPYSLPSAASRPDLWFDAVHPTTAGYALMADTLTAVIAEENGGGGLGAQSLGTSPLGG